MSGAIRETSRRASSRRSRIRGSATIGLSFLLALACALALGVAPASAAGYPSWADVVAARQNTAAAQAQVTQITALLASLQSQLQAAQADADAKGAAAYAAQQKYLDAETKQQTLQAQVDAATERAAKSRKQVGEYVAQLARGTGGADATTLSILTSGASAEDLLNGLSTAGELASREEGILQRATVERNQATQLTELAAQQAGLLATRKKAADEAEAAAVLAAASLQNALDAQTAHQQELNLQLAALTTQLTMTEAQYQAGVQAAAAAAAAAAARNRGQAGVVSAQGWALPTAGRITSPWGFRNDPAAHGAWRMHYGDDIANGCLQPIYAAHSGTVAYVGRYGDIGNYILIRDGDQYSTSYGHIADGQTFVRVGQSVSSGQNIARTGTTGASTGCHLYFQVYVNGSPVDPVPFMLARGVTIG